MGKTVDELILQARERMAEFGYQATTMQGYLASWRQVKRWCVSRGIGVYDDGVEERVIEELGLNSKRLSAHERSRLRHVRTLLSIEEHGGMPPLNRQAPPVVPDQFRGVYISYVSFLDHRDLSPRTRLVQSRCIRGFLQGLTIAKFKDLTMDDVTSHLEGLERMGAQTKAGVLYTIRTFVRWAAEEGLCPSTVGAAMPVIPGHKHATLPSSYAVEDIARVVANPGNECPKRDRAMLLLGAVLGLRAGEIRSLRLDHLDMRARQIRFTQPKTGHRVRLPLPEEVLLAVGDYIRSERPQSDDAHIFLHHRAPHDSFEESVISFHHVTTAAYERAGVDITAKHHGMHSLRHSVATNMLADDVPYPVISGVLGHANANTTRKYMAIDIARLRPLCLEVPCG